jgi:hypothetical protein
LIENDHRLNQIINIFNLTNCIREPTRLGALLDPILFSDELETTFSDVIQVDRIKSDHEATIAFFPISYDLQTNYKRDVWLYKHGNYDVRLKIFIIWFKRWSFSIDKFTFKSPVIIIRGDDSNALSIEI